eukprot:jgi/Tetstr1/440648/TSEL_028958.t1
MSGIGLPTDPKMVDAGKAAAVDIIETSAIAQDHIEAFIAGSAVKLRKLLAAAFIAHGSTPAFGQRLEAAIHSMEAVDDAHRNHDNFKNAGPGCEAAAPRATFAKDAAKDTGTSKAKVEALVADKPNDDGVLRRVVPRPLRFEEPPGAPSMQRCT